MPHFGARVSGKAQFDKEVATQKVGGHHFGRRVRGDIPADTSRNLQKRANEHGPRVGNQSSETNTKGEPGSMTVAEIAKVLAGNTTFFETLFEAELSRPGGARPEALSVFRTFELQGQNRLDVLDEIDTLLQAKRGEVGPGAGVAGAPTPPIASETETGGAGGEGDDLTEEEKAKQADERATEESRLAKLTVPDLNKEAKKLKLDTNTIEGTGADGAVLKGDLVKALLAAQFGPVS